MKDNDVVFVEYSGDVIIEETNKNSETINKEAGISSEDAGASNEGTASGCNGGMSDGSGTGSGQGNGGLGDGSIDGNGNGNGNGNGDDNVDGSGNGNDDGNGDDMPNRYYHDEKQKANEAGFKKGLLIGIFSMLGVLIVVVLVAFIYLAKIYPSLRPFKNTNPSAEERVDNSATLDMDQVETKLDVLQDIVSQQYLFDMDIEDVEEGIYKGYMQGLGDEYSQYYTKEEFEKISTSMEGVFYGIGATVQKDPDTGIVSVVNVIEGSPAEKAGVKADDIIYAVGDTLAIDVDLDTLVYDLIRGEKGTDVTITFIRDGEKLDITITRGEVANTTVYSELLEGDIGYIEVSQFTDETVPQFKTAIDDMVGQGAKGLVIDLRNNPGGVLMGAVEMADYILPDGVKEHDGMVVYTANKDGVGERFYATDGHEVDIPIVLLVNGNSASAAEVFTGAMMDYDKADVVGTTTFGKGIVQSVLPLSDGSAVKLTVEHYYTPDGTDLHGEGLTPDYEVELDEACETYTDEHDTQYAKAVEIINKKAK